jgi:hypothetical protein
MLIDSTPRIHITCSVLPSLLGPFSFCTNSSQYSIMISILPYLERCSGKLRLCIKKDKYADVYRHRDTQGALVEALLLATGALANDHLVTVLRALGTGLTGTLALGEPAPD